MRVAERAGQPAILTGRPESPKPHPHFKGDNLSISGFEQQP
jgi:hypothetical protein